MFTSTPTSREILTLAQVTVHSLQKNLVYDLEIKALTSSGQILLPESTSDQQIFKRRLRSTSFRSFGTENSGSPSSESTLSTYGSYSDNEELNQFSERDERLRIVFDDFDYSDC
ncbi:hypothetical protein G9A89_009868 [Geosiphon pyriformis]|nr:hypothetical protein G9A89_009868 [Geosiphon pyriformis]